MKITKRQLRKIILEALTLEEKRPAREDDELMDLWNSIKEDLELLRVGFESSETGSHRGLSNSVSQFIKSIEGGIRFVSYTGADKLPEDPDLAKQISLRGHRN